MEYCYYCNWFKFYLAAQSLGRLKKNSHIFNKLSQALLNAGEGWAGEGRHVQKTRCRAVELINFEATCLISGVSPHWLSLS